MTNKEFKGFVRLSSDQYAELKLNGSLVIEGRTIEYSPLDTIYMITDAGNMIDVANTTEGEQNDVVLNITNNILRAQLNQTIKTTINNKQDKLTFDTTPTINSNNPVTSGGVYGALALKQDKLATTNVDSGTIDQNIGFDAQGNLVRAIPSGGDKLYMHNIKLGDRNGCVIYSTSSMVFTNNTLAKWLYDNNFRSRSSCLYVGSGGWCSGSTFRVESGIYANNETQIGMASINYTYNSETNSFSYVQSQNAMRFISDTVTEL